MFLCARKVSNNLKLCTPFPNPNPNPRRIWASLQFAAPMSKSNLRVVWRKDTKLNQAIEEDKHWRLCARVLNEVLNQPGQVIPLGHLHKLRERLQLSVSITTFLDQNPNLFDIYTDRIRPKSPRVKFVRVSDAVHRFLEDEKRIYQENEALIVAKLCKLLMMARHRTVSTGKLVLARSEFGFPDDFLVSLVPKYPEYFRRVESPGEGKSFLKLVSWNPEFAKSVIEKQAAEEERLTGNQVRPGFTVKLPNGFFLKREMREWVRDWMELPYISPYDVASGLNGSEMEKRTVGVFHELLSLSIYKRLPVPILGKFRRDYGFPHAFTDIFTRHSGIFYMSLKGDMQTAMLREAYRDEELIDRDPLLQVRDKFVGMLEDGRREKEEHLRLWRETVQKDMEMMARRSRGMEEHDSNDPFLADREGMETNKACAAF